MMLLIANVAPLGPEWLDHPLKGEWADQRECHICGNAISAGMPYRRECHIGGDFLLIYQIEANTINFVRSGDHPELFSN
jgi:mRNA interferase YafQ